MARCAIIESGTVVNVVEWDGETPWNPPAGTQLVEIPDSAPVGPEWGYDGETFTAAPADGTPDKGPAPVDQLVESLKRATTVAALKAALLEHFAPVRTTGA